MAHFIVTFRIKNDDTYQDRYDTFVAKAKELAWLAPWDETTSFLAFRASDSALTAASLCDSLYYGSGFSSAKDLMVVVDLDRREKATKGLIQYEALLDAGLGF